MILVFQRKTKKVNKKKKKPINPFRFEDMFKEIIMALGQGSWKYMKMCGN